MMKTKSKEPSRRQNSIRKQSTKNGKKGSRKIIAGENSIQMNNE